MEISGGNGSLWFAVNRSKYGLNANSLDSNIVSHGLSQSPWKEISQGLNTFSACCNFVGGNGERVRFWEDSWVEEIAFSHSFSRLCKLSQFRMFSFARMGVNSSSLPLAWNFGYQRNLNG